MTIDDSWTKVDNPFNKPSFDSDSFLQGLPIIADAFLGTNFYGNNVNKQIANQNLAWQKEYAEKQEGLIREAWQREDNAVSRRVADLKAAGLSPTLAAGSAAATSQPIQLKAPQNEFRYENPFGGGILSSLAQVMSIKSQMLQNEYLEKQIQHYGEPAWFKGLQAILDKFGEKGFGGSLITNIVNGVENAMDAAGVEHGKVEFTPKYGFTFAKPTSGVQASVPAVIESLKGFDATVTRSSDGKYDVTFGSAKAERDWYLSIGGTTSEWYYGIQKYGSPEAFLLHILQTGGNYF